jgi:hypothetical protein
MKKVILALLVVLLLAFSQQPVFAGKPPWAGQEKAKGASTGILGDNVTGEKYAIVIGISDYERTTDPYDPPYCDKDALSVNYTLINVFDYKAENVFTFIDSSANKTDIVAAIEQVANLEEAGDEVVFYFSGLGQRYYGAYDADGDPEDVDEWLKCYDGGWLVDGELRDMFDEYDTSRIVFILDCSRSGGYDDLVDEGRIVCTSTTENGYAWFDHDLEHSEFTYYLVVDGILAGNADVFDHDGDSILGEPDDVTIEEAVDYAKSIKASRLNKTQIYDQFPNDLLL